MHRNTPTEEEVKVIVSESKSIADVCRALNIVARGSNYKTVKNLLNKYNITTEHFTGAAWNQGDRYRPLKAPAPLELILIKGSIYQSHKLKQRLISEGIKEHRCESCTLDTWLGELIKLELHHINGDSNDNRIENLQILCPNCHSITDNYRAKNKASKSEPTKEWLERPEFIRKEKPESKPKVSLVKVAKICKGCGNEYLGKSKKYCGIECYQETQRDNIPKVPELLEKFKELKSFVAVGKYYNVSNNAVKKWCKRYEILEMIDKD